MTPRWVVVSGDFNRYGGMDAANWALARYLATVAQVEIVAHSADEELAAMPTATLHPVWRPFGKHLLGERLLDRAGRIVARRLKTEKAHVVVNGGNCRWFDISWVHYCHAAYSPPTPRGVLRRAKLAAHRVRSVAREREVLSAARVVVCNSQVTARHAIELTGVQEDRVRVVYYGTEPGRFGPVSSGDQKAARRELKLDDRPWAVFVGALGDARKGFDTLYFAWRELCRARGWDVNLVVVGRGADLATWQAQACADGLVDRIRFLGFRQDVPAVLAACEVLVHPARYEAYGLGVHEALCRGLPAIVPATAGVAERYPPELSGLLLGNPDDSRELADVLQAWRRALETWPGRIALFAESLRARTWDDMAAEFVRVCDSNESDE